MIVTGGNFGHETSSSEILLMEYNELTNWEVKWRRWTLLRQNLPVTLLRPVLTHINNVIYLTGQSAFSSALLMKPSCPILFTGGKSEGELQSSVLEFDNYEYTWTHVGNTLDSRFAHAVSIVDFSYFDAVCRYNEVRYAS